MGTKMQYKSSLPGYHSVGDLNEDFSSFNCLVQFADRIFPNRESYSKILSKARADAYRGSDRDVLKLTMLEQEAIFKYQVYELHRLYRIQRDLMEEVRRCRNHMAGEALFTSSPLAYEKVRKCGVENSSARLLCVKDNHCLVTNDEGLVSRPRKVGRKVFDLQLPADEYIDSEDEEHFDDNGGSGEAQGIDLSRKPMLQLLDFRREISRDGSETMTEINGGPLPWYIRSNEKPHFSQRLGHKEKVLVSSKPDRGFCSEVNDARAFYQDNKWKEHQWKDEPVYDMQMGKRFNNRAESKDGEAFVLSSLSDGHQFSQFDWGKAWPRSHFSWGNLNWNAFCGQMHPSCNTAISLHKSSVSAGYNCRLHVDHGLAVFSNDKKVSDRNLTRNMKSGSSTWSRKLLGFPIYESENNDGSPSRSSNGEAKDKCKSIELDINLSCDALDSEEGKQAIDLNSCYTAEDEGPAQFSTSRTDKRVLLGIDLEYPALPEPEENIIPQKKAQQNELVTLAAEAIVAISSVSCDHRSENPAKNSQEDSSCNNLNWFADIVLRGQYELSDTDNGNKPSDKDVDFFVMMTLGLTETNKEHIAPRPVLKDTKEEQGGPTKLQNRCRKGQARRGRQIRDFQRDTLPTIASLSRQKVKEDIQIFDDIMREIGHPLPSRLARRNSKMKNCASPLRRQRTIITTPARTIVGLNDMDLKGWGKTTQGPRQQRSAHGNQY